MRKFVQFVKSRASIILAVLAVILMIVCSAPLSATTLIYKNFDELVSEADAIVSGTVKNIESHYGPGKSIYTFITLKDLRIVNGEYNQDTLGLRIEGGDVNGDRLRVHGAPKFKEGDSILIFLQGNGREEVPIVGWTQGIMRIVIDTTTQQEIITDNDGNRIFGINENNLIKEHRIQNEEQIIKMNGVSKKGNFSPGVTENGEVADLVAEKT